MGDVADRGNAMPAKGLKKDALSFVSNVTIAISSTSPAYSIAATLGPIVGFAALETPSIMVLAFIPMLFVAVACYHLNRADPDCGTTFSWVTRAMGPDAGWMGGWSIIVTNILVMPSLADISGRYSFRLLGFDDPSGVEVALAGIAWMVVLTVICYLGIALSARTQQWLLAAELGILALFAVVALGQVYLGHAPAEAQPVSLAWFNPFRIGDFSRFTEAMVLAVFIYWGWDSCISVNEETRDPHIAPGHAAVVSTVILVGLYALVAVAAVAVAGPGLFAQNGSDVLAPLGQSVLGTPVGKLLVLAVLTSSLASTQTSILPAARMALSMAHAGANPEHFGRVHPHHLSPGVATLTMGAVSIVWYVGMTILSADVLADSITALGLMIAFYYGLTAFACVVFYRREIVRSFGNFVSMGVVPAAGGVIMFLLLAKSVFAPGEATTSQIRVLGVGGPIIIGVGAVIVGFLLMLVARFGLPAFFRREREVFEARGLPAGAGASGLPRASGGVKSG
jgi:amino acid transporter